MTADLWAVGVMSLYRADGRVPIRGMRPPAMIADFVALCAAADDRLWRFGRICLRLVFVSKRPPAVDLD